MSRGRLQEVCLKMRNCLETDWARMENACAHWRRVCAFSRRAFRNGELQVRPQSRAGSAESFGEVGGLSGFRPFGRFLPKFLYSFRNLHILGYGRRCGYFPALHIRLRADSSRAFLNTATPAIFPLKKFPIPPFSMTAPTVKSEPLSPIPCG